MGLAIAILCTLTMSPCFAEGAHGAGLDKLQEEMFDEEFYPTPPEVIATMLRPYRDSNGRYPDLVGKKILDPSAGSGSLLTYAFEQMRHQYPRYDCLDAVELNPTCQTLLKALPYVDVVGDDFMEFETKRSYDLVLMNPPFSVGTKHLIRAWNMIERGDVVCLLNAENVRNPHTASRKGVVDLIDQHGSVEYLGPVFADAERKTDVEVALVRLSKAEKTDRFAFWNDAYFSKEAFDFELNEETLGNAPAVNDLVAAMVSQYRMVEGVFVEYLKARRRLRYHVKPLIDGTYVTLEKMLEAAEAWDDDPNSIVRKFLKQLSEQGWRSIMVRTRIMDLMTASVRKDFEAMQDSQAAMAFTEENIHALFNLLFENQHKILQRSVEESFDLMTRYHKVNRVHAEGWVSNDAFKVNRKVVLPGMVRLGYVSGLNVCDYGRTNLNDIDRGVAMVRGRKLTQVVSIVQALGKRFDGMKLHGGAIPNNTCESEYFHIRFFMKGTIHLTFLDEQVWEQFNIAAAQCKKWLPMDYKRDPDGDGMQDGPMTANGTQLLLTT